MQPPERLSDQVDAQLPAFTWEINSSGNMASLVVCAVNSQYFIHGPQMKSCSKVLESEKNPLSV